MSRIGLKSPLIEDATIAQLAIMMGRLDRRPADGKIALHRHTVLLRAAIQVERALREHIRAKAPGHNTKVFN